MLRFITYLHMVEMVLPAFYLPSLGPEDCLCLGNILFSTFSYIWFVKAAKRDMNIPRILGKGSGNGMDGELFPIIGFYCMKVDIIRSLFLFFQVKPLLFSPGLKKRNRIINVPFDAGALKEFYLNI